MIRDINSNVIMDIYYEKKYNLKFLWKWETIKYIFCETWYPSRVCFDSTFIYHSNGCSDRCEGWFINGVVICRQYCFVWGIIK